MNVSNVNGRRVAVQGVYCSIECYRASAAGAWASEARTLLSPALVVSSPLVSSPVLSGLASLMADVPKLSITLLGAGQEVGRSCCVMQYRGRTIVCDAGVHPAYSGIASLPFIDELDWSTVDVLLITQYV